MENTKRKLGLQTVDFTRLHTPQEFNSAALLIAEECVTTGFFLIKVPQKVGQQMPLVLQAARELFQLPLQEKLKLKNDQDTQHQINGSSIPGTGCGYRELGTDPNFFQDTRDSFNMGPRVSLAEISTYGYSGSGITKWPDESLLPGWRDIMQDYAGMLLEICCTLRKLVAAALNLSESFFEAPGYFDKGTWLLGLTFYPARKSNVQKGIFGIRPHSDFGIFTLLLNDSQPGLQVCLNKTANSSDRVWLDVECPPPGHLTVNLGQILERWTNGKFKATLHRVVLDGKSERISVPFFYETNINCIIQPIIDDDTTSDSKSWKTTPARILLERLHKADNDFE